MQRSKSNWVRSSLLVGFASGLVPLTRTGEAAVVYGNFTGPDVTYLNVSEIPTQLPPPTPVELFGPPILSGNSLTFNPIFAASASGGSLELQDGRLTTNIVPTGSNGLTTISLVEGGGWAVGGGTAATTALDSLLVNQLFITSVNNTSITPIPVPATITFTDTNSGSATVIKTTNTIEFTGTSGFSTGTWNGTATFNLPGALANAGLSGKITGLSLALDDQLAVTSEPGSVSFIDKKFFDINTNTSVPEPASITGMLLGAGGLLSRRRRQTIAV